MTATTLYRPDCEDETSALIEQTLTILVDMRVRKEVVAGVLTLPAHMAPGLCSSSVAEGDTGTLRAALRLLLPSRTGIGEVWFRVRFGWTDEEIACIVILMRLVATTLRVQSAHVVLGGTAETMLRDAERVEDFARGWPFSIPPVPDNVDGEE